MPKEYAFRTKSGRLTRYALGCGYVEKRTDKQGRTFRMWMEGPMIHVRCTQEEPFRRLFWESTYSIAKARRMFDGKDVEV